MYIKYHDQCNILTYMLLKQAKDKMMITTVVSTPMAVDMPMITKLIVLIFLLNIVQVLQLGLQTPPLRKKSSRQTIDDTVLLILMSSLFTVLNID